MTGNDIKRAAAARRLLRTIAIGDTVLTTASCSAGPGRVGTVVGTNAYALRDGIRRVQVRFDDGTLRSVLPSSITTEGVSV